MASGRPTIAATEWPARQGIVHFGIDAMRRGPEGRVNALVHRACLDLDITHIESLCKNYPAAASLPYQPADEVARRDGIAHSRCGRVRLVMEEKRR